MRPDPSKRVIVYVTPMESATDYARDTIESLLISARILCTVSVGEDRYDTNIFECIQKMALRINAHSKRDPESLYAYVTVSNISLKSAPDKEYMFCIVLAKYGNSRIVLATDSSPREDAANDVRLPFAQRAIKALQSIGLGATTGDPEDEKYAISVAATIASNFFQETLDLSEKSKEIRQ